MLRFGVTLGLIVVVALGCSGEIGASGGASGGGAGAGGSPSGGSGEGGSGAIGGEGGVGAGVGAGGVGAGVGGVGGETTGGSGGSAVPCDVDGAPGECLDVTLCTDGGVSIPGYCPGPANIQCCIQTAVSCDPTLHVEPNDGLTEGPGEGNCPPGMLLVDAFCVDRFEASLETLDGLPWSPYFNPAGVEVRAVSIEGAVPQAYISGDQAAKACENAGKRLCTDAEWLRACQGPTFATYPYGDALEPGVCNDARAEHPVIEYYGTDASWIWSELDNACIDQLHDSLDRAGENPGCITAEGAYDMMGNLHEWTADPAGTFRGGYYVDTVQNGPGCLYKTTAHTTSYWDYSTGFRCCGDVP